MFVSWVNCFYSEIITCDHTSNRLALFIWWTKSHSNLGKYENIFRLWKFWPMIRVPAKKESKVTHIESIIQHLSRTVKCNLFMDFSLTSIFPQGLGYNLITRALIHTSTIAKVHTTNDRQSFIHEPAVERHKFRYSPVLL